MSRIINVYNKYHLGDNIFNIIFFNKISKYLENNNIVINYYLLPCYKYQVSEFINSKNIVLFDYSELDSTMNMFMHLWIDDERFQLRCCKSIKKIPYNMFLAAFFNQILRIWNLPISIKNIIYDDTNLLDRYNNLDNKYQNIDILFINSLALSGQFDNNENEWYNFIQNFTNYKIVTTKKIEGINCTLDDDLTIKDIASLSTNCKVIVFVNTGVAPGLFNEYTMQNVKKFYCLDNRCYYNFPLYPKFQNFKCLKDICINDIITDLTP